MVSDLFMLSPSLFIMTISRSRLLGMWPYLEIPTNGLTKADQTVSGFFGNEEGGTSRPAFHAGESLAGNDSLEASSTGSSSTIGDRNSGLGVLLDSCLVRLFAINWPEPDFCSSWWRVSTAFKWPRKKVLSCHPERSKGSAFSPNTRQKQIPRANCALGMTLLGFFRSLLCRNGSSAPREPVLGSFRIGDHTGCTHQP